MIKQFLEFFKKRDDEHKGLLMRWLNLIEVRDSLTKDH